MNEPKTMPCQECGCTTHFPDLGMCAACYRKRVEAERKKRDAKKAWANIPDGSDLRLDGDGNWVQPTKV